MSSPSVTLSPLHWGFFIKLNCYESYITFAIKEQTSGEEKCKKINPPASSKVTLL